MPKQKNETQTGITGIGNSFDINKKTTLNVDHSISKYFLAKVSAFQIYLSNISASCTAIDLKVYDDSNCDNNFFPETEASITFSMTTTTKGAAVILVDCILYSEAELLYCLVKTDAGTADVDKIIITYES